MSPPPSFLGIDVSKDFLDLHVRPAGEAARVANDPAGVAAPAARADVRAAALVVIEATGGYEHPVAATVGGHHPDRPLTTNTVTPPQRGEGTGQDPPSG